MAASRTDIEHEVERQAGVHAAIEERGEALIITGLVDTQGEHDAVLDVVSALAPEKQIVDNIDVVSLLPEEVAGLSLSEAEAGHFMAATPETSDDEGLEPGDFTDQETLSNPLGRGWPQWRRRGR
jgi:hypothetical protein